MKIPTILIIDHAAKSLTLDGREVAPAHSIGSDIEVDGTGMIGKATITLYAVNILIRSASGRESRPTASAEATRIVRRGLRDVLDWLGEPYSEETT